MAALQATLRHPGAPSTAAIEVVNLVARTQDETRSPLVPAAAIDRIRVMRGTTEIGSLADPPTTGDTMTIPLSGLAIGPGDAVDVMLVIDIEAGAPGIGLELLVDQAGIVALDANLQAAVAVLPESGTAFPLSSGITQLQPPADELTVGFTSNMPTVLAPDTDRLPVATLILENSATSMVGSITVDHLDIRAADDDYTPLNVGDLIDGLQVTVGADIWAVAAPAPGDSTACMTAAQPLVLGPNETATLRVRVDFRSDVSISSLRLGFRREDIGAVQPAGALFNVRVEPALGDEFPFWTELGNFSEAGLEESYSNYPNPFAAGRESTTFVYTLPKPGTVSLRVLTARGETVITLVDQVNKSSGIHQNDRWNGLNGRGYTVANGVYLGELRVNFDDGTETRLLRKIAVVR
jgi:hypothetical protein